MRARRGHSSLLGTQQDSIFVRGFGVFYTLLPSEKDSIAEATINVVFVRCFLIVGWGRTHMHHMHSL